MGFFDAIDYIGKELKKELNIVNEDPKLQYEIEQLKMSYIKKENIELIEKYKNSDMSKDGAKIRQVIEEILIDRNVLLPLYKELFMTDIDKEITGYLFNKYLSASEEQQIDEHKFISNSKFYRKNNKTSFLRKLKLGILKECGFSGL